MGLKNYKYHLVGAVVLIGLISIFVSISSIPAGMFRAPIIDSTTTDVNKGILTVPGMYSSIGDAIRAANRGDTIIISPGKYEEGEIKVQKDLTFWGSGPHETTVYGKFLIYADDVTIQGLKISPTTYSNFGTVDIIGTGIVIQNNIIEGYEYTTPAIRIEATDSASIENNVLTKASIAIANCYLEEFTAKNNILYRVGMDTDYCPLTPRNEKIIFSYNIYYEVETSHVFDYNRFDGGGNMRTDPKFVDKKIYSLDYGSPAIDAGDPKSEYSEEPLPDGGRINVGAYGNTGWATRSYSSCGETLHNHCSGSNRCNNGIFEKNCDICDC